MGNFQKTLDALQPYVIGIRYVDGVPVVDTLFKNEWVLPDDKYIKKVKGNDELNYYMLYSDFENYGIDDLLKYVERTIRINQEREKKHELLIVKINELKELFKRTSLEKLTTLKFSFGEIDTLTPKINELDVLDNETSNTNEIEPNNDVLPINEENLSEEELEILEEERRAERNRKIIEEKKKASKKAPKIELPPKQLAIQPSNNYDVFTETCECGENEACEKCIDTK